MPAEHTCTHCPDHHHHHHHTLFLTCQSQSLTYLHMSMFRFYTPCLLPNPCYCVHPPPPMSHLPIVPVLDVLAHDVTHSPHIRPVLPAEHIAAVRVGQAVLPLYAGDGLARLLSIRTRSRPVDCRVCRQPQTQVRDTWQGTGLCWAQKHKETNLSLQPEA
jgi:hypothetical protein